LSFIDYVTTELNNCEKTFHSNEHNEQRTTDNEQRTTNNEQRTTNNERQANEQRTTNNEQRTTNNEQQTTRKKKDMEVWNYTCYPLQGGIGVDCGLCRRPKQYLIF
jgi:hypothetical protein